MSVEKHSSPPFAPLRRVITGHTTEGKSVIVEVSPHTLDGATNGTYFTDLFRKDEFPSAHDIEFKDLTKEHERDFFGENRSSLRLLEFPPGGSPSPFHRTVTIDYGIVLSGSLTLILDNEKRAVLYAGDVVQRGTIHGWVNEGTEWARVFFVLHPAKNV